MYEPHPDFESPAPGSILWRYQDLPRYLDLLLRSALFFNRADKFEDPFEGKFNKLSREAVLEAAGDGGNVMEEQRLEELLREVSEKRVTVTVNPWHENQDENYAMWNIYARGSYGLAIQSTYERLKQAFACSDKPVNIGKVIYYNEQREHIPLNSSFSPLLWKRKIYQYEREVRCCTLISDTEDDHFNWQSQDEYSGVFVPVDLQVLIERIYISPYSPGWFRDLIARVNEQFKIRSEIVHSAIFHSENFY